MARPRKYKDDDSRKEAAKQAKIRYEQKKKNGAAIRAKRSAPRKDVLLIRDTPQSIRWSIHRRVQYTPPPIPEDLLGNYSLDLNWIKKSFNGSTSFIKGFERERVVYGSMGWWLEYPPVGDESFESVLDSYLIDDLLDIMDGWNLRFILDSFCEWWRGSPRRGREQRSYLVSVAIGLLKRLAALLDELRDLDAWVKSQPCENSQPKTVAIAHRFRYWRYLEGTFIRSELWWRYHKPLEEVFLRYKDRKLDWQACWFEDPLPQEVHDRITKLIECNTVDPISPEELKATSDSDYDSDDSADDEQ